MAWRFSWSFAAYYSRQLPYARWGTWFSVKPVTWSELEVFKCCRLQLQVFCDGCRRCAAAGVRGVSLGRRCCWRSSGDLAVALGDVVTLLCPGQVCCSPAKFLPCCRLQMRWLQKKRTENAQKCATLIQEKSWNFKLVRTHVRIIFWR